MLPHPLAILSVDEVNAARDVILAKHKDGDKVIDFREIYLEEPPKAELVKFLELEHNGSLSDSSSRPSRTALVQYDVIDTSGVPKHHESCIDLQAKQELKHEIVASEHHACLTL